MRSNVCPGRIFNCTATSRCLSSARPVPVDHEISRFDWSKAQPQHRRHRPGPSGSCISAKKSLPQLHSPVASRDKNIVSTNLAVPASPADLMYTGGHKIPVTTKLHIVTPEEDVPRGIWPVFRLMDETGYFRDPSMDGTDQKRTIPQMASSHTPDLDDLRAHLSKIYPFHRREFEHSGLLQSAKHVYPDLENSRNTLLRAHRQIIRLRTMDTILMNAQRQGRISFYMTCTGEEAIHIGAASALNIGDPILAQYREQGLIMWRGFTLDQFTDQCFSNEADMGKGRQMPIHYGSRALNYHTISSPLGTQLPQAVGVAYRLKLNGNRNVSVALFGDGCASTPDFHSALNFAAVLKSPTLFICRNNGYAISTSVEDQYAGDGIISRAPGYGMAGIRVDGNDIFAVHAAVREAKQYALERHAPVLIECMTYRQGHHSTSDDSSRYRSSEEVEAFAETCDPLTRLENFLTQHEWLNEEKAKEIRDEEKQAVIKAMNQAERKPRPKLDYMFTDVYHDMPPHLVEQQTQLHDHLSKYPNEY